MNNRQAHGGSRHIVDRGWSLHIGPVRLAGWHRCYADDAVAHPPPARPWAFLFSGRMALTTGVMCVCTFVATSLVAERVGARPAYAITIPVPPPGPAVTRHAHSTRPGHRMNGTAPPTETRGTATPANLRPVAATTIASRRSLTLALGGDEDATPERTAEMSQAGAVKTALATGDMQEWRDTGTGQHGFVVAGPLQDEGGSRCRAMAVLTRSTDGDAVEQRHDCLR